MLFAAATPLSAYHAADAAPCRHFIAMSLHAAAAAMPAEFYAPTAA